MTGGEPRPAAPLATFELTKSNRARARKTIAEYPTGRQQSAVLPVLALCQQQAGGWLPQAAIEYVAGFLDMAAIRVYEVATFYTMFKLRPVGRHLVQVCTTTPCWLMGSDRIVEACEQTLGIKLGETTDDDAFTLGEAECLCACVNAPVMQIGDEYYEDLDAEAVKTVLEAFKRGETPPPGSQTGRQFSCPIGGATTLKDVPLSEGG